MKIRNNLAFLAVVLVAGLVLAAPMSVLAQEECKGTPDDPYISPERQEFLEGEPYKGKTINILAPKTTVSKPLYDFAKQWRKETGGKVNITEVPLATFHQKIFTDLITGMGQYDGFLTASWYYGDYFEGTRYIVPIEQYMEDPKMPYWCPGTVSPAIEQLMKWGGEWYGLPNDNDGQAFYYRKDILQKEEYKEEFEDEYGYTYHLPPRDHQEIIDIAQFFNEWDWDEDGKKDYGFTGHFKVGGQGMFHYMTWAAPYVISPENKYFWFNPDTMEPLVNSAGHLRALNDLKELVEAGPRAMMAWTLGEAWDLFLKGDAVVAFTWGDLGALAQDEETSKVKGKIGVSVLPGTMEAYNPIDDEWVEFDEPNVVGNNIGGSWHGVISKYSDNPQMTYDYFAYMSKIDNAFWNQMRGWTGVDVGRSFAFLERHGGSASVEDFTEQGWSENGAIEMSKGYHENFYADQQFNLLRIPGAEEYARAVDVIISQVLSGDADPKKALDKLADRFNDITARHGRESQKEYYKQMLGE